MKTTVLLVILETSVTFRNGLTGLSQRVCNHTLEILEVIEKFRLYGYQIFKAGPILFGGIPGRSSISFVPGELNLKS